MAFVDWSDPEDMFDLLVDYVTDVLADADDPGRRRFLSRLLGSLAGLQERFAELTAAQRVEALRELQLSAEEDFSGDPVIQHLHDCATELERLDAHD